MSALFTTGCCETYRVETLVGPITEGISLRTLDSSTVSLLEELMDQEDTINQDSATAGNVNAHTVVDFFNKISHSSSVFFRFLPRSWSSLTS